MDQDNYVYELEQALTRLLDAFEPAEDGNGYFFWEDGDPLCRVEGEVAQAVDHANEILYGDSFNDD